jgi:hypothetical protein
MMALEERFEITINEEGEQQSLMDPSGVFRGLNPCIRVDCQTAHQ